MHVINLLKETIILAQGSQSILISPAALGPVVWLAAVMGAGSRGSCTSLGSSPRKQRTERKQWEVPF